jgi:hypothetical protein
MLTNTATATTDLTPPQCTPPNGMRIAGAPRAYGVAAAAAAAQLMGWAAAPAVAAHSCLDGLVVLLEGLGPLLLL